MLFSNQERTTEARNEKSRKEGRILTDCIYKEVCTAECSDCCQRYLEMTYLIAESGIYMPEQYLKSLYAPDCDYEQYLKLAEIKDDIVNFVKSGRNLYIASENTGNGKTTWAVKLMLKYFDEVWAGNGFRTRGLFVHVPTFLAQAKNFNHPLLEEYKNNLMYSDLVIWDDIGCTELSNYDISVLLIYLEQVYRKNK